MNDRSTIHASFSIERTYPVPPAKVFAAFADEATKRSWFKGPEDWYQGEQSFDFRPGGVETDVGGPTADEVHGFTCRYYDIVPDERIVYAYDMDTNGQHASLSVASIELEAVDGGTRLTLTEQGVFLDGVHDAAEREQGTNLLFDALDVFLAQT
jgi:uncharacterized protein YndB with AHSA1/START domain